MTSKFFALLLLFCAVGRTSSLRPPATWPQCPDCQKMVSNSADACPGCGYSFEKARIAKQRAAEKAASERAEKEKRRLETKRRNDAIALAREKAKRSFEEFDLVRQERDLEAHGIEFAESERKRRAKMRKNTKLIWRHRALKPPNEAAIVDRTPTKNGRGRTWQRKI